MKLKHVWCVYDVFKASKVIKPLTVMGTSTVSKSTPFSARHVYVAVSVTRDSLMVSWPLSSLMTWRDPGAGLMTSPLRRHWMRRLCASDGSVVALQVTVTSFGADITWGCDLSTMTVLATAHEHHNSQWSHSQAPLIRSQHTALHKCVVIDWLNGQSCMIHSSNEFKRRWLVNFIPASSAAYLRM